MPRGVCRALTFRDGGGTAGSLGRLAVAAFALLFAFAVYAFSVASDDLGDAPLFLLVVPMALCAFMYGVKGGIYSTLCGSALATAWWLGEGHPGGAAWLGSRVTTYVLIGVLLGWLVESRRALVRELEQHSELSLDMIATANFDGFFTRVNPAFTRTLGYTVEELLSRPFLDFVHPEDVEPTLAAVHEQTEAGQDVVNFQNRYRCKDGTYRWLEWMSRPDGEGRALIAVARDVTDRKELEQREHEYQQRLEQAVQERTQELRRRNRELDEARRDNLRRLALAAEFRDDDTWEHTTRVGSAAALIAAQLGLPEDEVALIREAAPLHDIGKLGVSDTVLLKPGRLTAAEFEQVKRHAGIGATILSGSSSKVLRVAEEIALGHHEWWDGSGYPSGRRGVEIPVSARIVALVDVFDALTHDRPYKRAWPVEQACAEIRRLGGRQFDPEVVSAFDRLDAYMLAGFPTPPGESVSGPPVRAVA